MARKVQVMLVDDLDGGTAEETVAFAIDGTSYEIDLSSDNAAALRDSVEKYVAAARKAGRGGTRTNRRPAATSQRSGREQNQAIREWAKGKGLQVSDRGRIPQEVIDQYNSEH
ncbi:Lsr2 family protein [Cryptosporangium sp. NPDC048952]|uniref:histone-like nucleoid-structuring protein Lsr2 n=1 Tax=Cryptosporangium sp. NPDC048952 TaxID=3363961 RepID=UPI003715F03B